MSAGIYFFNHGEKCLARLAVAIYSLRKHYDGHICVLDTNPADTRVQDICLALRASLRDVKLVQLRRNSCYVTKSTLWRRMLDDACLLVDSDVLFLKSPQPLLEMVADKTAPGFLLTEFSNWRCDGRIVGGRLEKWRGVRCDGIDCAALVEQARSRRASAVNTGVVGMRPDLETARTLEAWERLTLAGRRNPWTDELAAQIIAEQFPHQLAPEIYNSSVLYGIDKASAVIWHAHGHKELRPEAGGKWIAAYLECCELGIAGIEQWGASTDSRLAGLA